MRSWLGLLARLLKGNSSAAVVVQIAMTNGLMLGMQVLAGIATARALKADGRGELGALLLWPQLAGYAFAFSMPAALLYYANKEPENRNAIVSCALTLSVAGGLLALCAGVLGMPALLHTATPETVSFARLMMGFAPLATAGTVLIAALQLEGQFRLYNRLRYLPVAATLAGLVLLLVAGRMSPRTAALAYLLPGIPVFVSLAVWLWRHFRLSLLGTAAVAPRLLQYGARAYGGEAAGYLVTTLDKVLLVNLLSPAHFGIYMVVFNLSRLLTTFSSAVAPVLLPRSAGKSAGEVIGMTSRALRSTLPILVLGALAFFAAGSLVLRFWYGAEFAAGYVALCLLVLDAAISGVAYIAMQPFFALNRPGVITVIQVLSLPVMVVGFLVLVPRFGLNGAAAAVLAATVFRAAAIYLTFGRFLRTRPPRLWPQLQDSLELIRKLKATGSSS
jgi:O-antigen/teichoic acid export membrane protein